MIQLLLRSTDKYHGDKNGEGGRESSCFLDILIKWTFGKQIQNQHFQIHSSEEITLANKGK